MTTYPDPCTVALMVKITVKPEFKERFLHVLDKLKGKLKSRDDLVHFFQLAVPTLPNEIRFLEIWQKHDNESETVAAEPYMKRYLDVVGPMLACPIKATPVSVIDHIVTASV